MNEFKTPGQLVGALMKERGWTNRVLAIVLDMTEPVISKIVSDTRPIDARLAVLLEETFSVRAEDFLLLQKKYDLAKARIESVPDPTRAVRAAAFGDLPISQMIKRGWLDAKSIRDVAKVERELCRFFSVNRLEDAEIMPHAAKRTEVSVDATPSQLVWLHRVRKIADEMLVGGYSQSSVQHAITELKPLRAHPENLRHVPRILAEAGIRFVVCEALPGSKIDGVCFWLNEHSPVIGMTLRFDRVDNFLFVLRHELEHVLQRDGLEHAMLDVDLGRESDQASCVPSVIEQELRANEQAAEFCVPQNMLAKFIAKKSPVFSERDLIGFSRSLKIHPGLVAGQLQRHTGKYQLFRHHLAAIRDIVTPNAVTDGWGSFYPIET